MDLRFLFGVFVGSLLVLSIEASQCNNKDECVYIIIEVLESILVGYLLGLAIVAILAIIFVFILFVWVVIEEYLIPLCKRNPPKNRSIELSII